MGVGGGWEGGEGEGEMFVSVYPAAHKTILYYAKFCPGVSFQVYAVDT